MGFSFGNAIAAVEDSHVQACLMRLGNTVAANDKTLTTLTRNNRLVTNYALTAITLNAGAGMTGGGDLSADRTFNVGAGLGITVAADTVAVDQTFVPTWTGIHTFSAQDVHTSGIDLSTSGRVNSKVVEGSGTTLMLFKPTTAQTTAPTTSFVHQLQDSAGAVAMATYQGGKVEFGGNSSGTVDGMVVIGASTAKNGGIFFAPSDFTGSGQTFMSSTGTISGGYFKCGKAGSTTPSYTKQVAGIFETIIDSVLGANIDDSWGAWFRGQGVPGAGNSTRTWARVGGFKVWPALTTKNGGTYTDVFGGYISNVAAVAATTGLVVTNTYGFYIEQQTRGGTINNGIFLEYTSGTTYRAIAIRDQNAWIGSAAAGEITIGGTNFRATSTNQAFFSATAIAQPTTAIAASTFAANTSGIVNDTATWDGYTAGQVVKALRNLGLLA